MAANLRAKAAAFLKAAKENPKTTGGACAAIAGLTVATWNDPGIWLKAETYTLLFLALAALFGADQATKGKPPEV